MGEPTPTLSIVMPVFNEAEGIADVVGDLEQEILRQLDAEIVIVDDASSDSTPAILRRLAERDRRISVERSPANYGHGPSVRRGLELARGEWIFQLDSDGQVVVSDFWKLWSRRDDADFVIGVRANRCDPRHRLLLSAAVRASISVLTLRRVRDANAPFRLFRRAVWEDLRPFVDESVLAPSIVMTMAAIARGWRVLEVPVSHLPRRHGVSSLRFFRLVRFSLRGFGQVLAVRLRLARAQAGRAAR